MGQSLMVSHWNVSFLDHQSASGQKLAVVFFWRKGRGTCGHHMGGRGTLRESGHHMGGRGTLRESGNHGREGHFERGSL